MTRRLQPADNLLAAAVAETLTHLDLGEQDKAAAKLARHYADAIDAADDQGEALDKLGPKLLSCLESLGATPKARAALRKGDNGAPGQGKLGKLRAAQGA